MTSDFMGLRRSILLALGLQWSACAGEKETTPTTDTDADTDTDSDSDADTDADADADTDADTDTGSCPGAVQLLDARGLWSGFTRCGDGAILRIMAVDCDPVNPLPSCAGSSTSYSECDSDASCTDGPNGQCALHQGYDDYCGCAYSCATDSDCGAGEICLCGGIFPDIAPWSQCVPADCASPSDCPSGECGLAHYEYMGGCGWAGVRDELSCRTTYDECRGDNDCPTGNFCASGGSGTWSCGTSYGSCGRPLLVDGAPRLAPAREDTRWQEIAAPPEIEGDLRERLAEHWRDVGAMEHASVASFARISLQLMALSAPPDLLHETHLAAADEVEHARLAYGLASAYGAGDAGPGPLSLAGVSLLADRRAVIEGLIREACVGETVATAEILACASAAVDEDLRELLSRIASDEQRHAALGWKTLRWMLSGADREELDFAERIFAEATSALEASVPSALHVPDHGVIGGHALRLVRKQAIRSVIAPAIRSLFGQEAFEARC